jgi:hypothetical protein
VFLALGELRAHGPDAAPATTTLACHPAVGTTFGMFSAGAPHLLPADQRGEEAYSAVFDSPVLTEQLEILGRPRLVVWVDSDAEVTTFAARLCDVAPDGHSALVTKGVLNAAHRESHDQPSPLEHGQRYELTIALDATSWRFQPGHRLRLSVSNADFPNAWPAPTLAPSRLHLGGDYPSRLILPTVGPETEPLPPPDYAPSPFPLDAERLDDPPWQVTRDLMRGRTEVTIAGSATSEPDDGYLRETRYSATASVDERRPAHAWVRGHHVDRYRWPGQTIELQCRGQITSTESAFDVTLHVAITVDDLPHFSRRWVASFPRRLL